MHDPISAILAKHSSLAFARSALPDAPVVCEGRRRRRRIRVRMPRGR